VQAQLLQFIGNGKPKEECVCWVIWDSNKKESILRKIKTLKSEIFFAFVFSPKDDGKVTSQLSSADKAHGFLAWQQSC